MALSTQCHFCTESPPFYQRVTKVDPKIPNLRLVAVFPQSTSESESYLKNLDVRVDDVKQSPSLLGVRGTPTLILTDEQGAVVQSWYGKLSSTQEQEVLARLR